MNIASRLEAATKQYGVPLLVSGEMNDAISDPVQKYLRHIDTVTVKGSVKPMRLYTVDLDPSSLPPVVGKPNNKNANSYAKRQIKKKLDKGDSMSFELFEDSFAIRKMREVVSEDLNAF